MIAFNEVLSRLETTYGPTDDRTPRSVWELILLENVAYLARDEKRERAFSLLGQSVGLEPMQILGAPGSALEAVGRFGIAPSSTAAKLRTCAQLGLEHDAELADLASIPVQSCRKLLSRFPGIGAPAADRILTQAGLHPLVSVDSNGLRVLLRLGFGCEGPSYDKSYRSAIEAIRNQIVEDCGWLTEAFYLLRRHGKETCKTVGPKCEICPLADVCAYPAKARR